MTEFEDYGIYECDIVRYPKNVTKLSRAAKARITRRTSKSACFQNDIIHYELNIFDTRIEFFGPKGLNAEEIYSICEEIYITRDFELDK